MINKYSPIPLYYQLVDEITSQINSGKLAVGSKLPAERELCQIYDLSRTTVRQAIQELERMGCVVCMHGKGNFITCPMIRQQLLTIYSFSGEMKKQGKVPSTKLISHCIIPCDCKLAEELKVETGTPVYEFKRVRLADNEPMMFVTTYLPVSRFPNFDGEKLATVSLYQIMTEEYGIKLTEVNESMQAVSIRRNEAMLLETVEGEPAMMIRRKSFEGELVVEYAVGITRCDRFKYEVTLKNKPEGNGL